MNGDESETGTEANAVMGRPRKAGAWHERTFSVRVPEGAREGLVRLASEGRVSLGEAVAGLVRKAISRRRKRA